MSVTKSLGDRARAAGECVWKTAGKLHEFPRTTRDGHAENHVKRSGDGSQRASPREPNTAHKFYKYSSP